MLERVTYDISRPSINVGIIGEVSCGKSTFINSLFVQKFGNMRKKRTTMSINIFKESDLAANERPDAVEINRILAEHEKKCTENNQHKLEEIKEFEFFTNPIRHFYNERKYKLNIIDIPGFNDRTSNKILLQWLEKKIYLFDVILFMIDINSALNTESEIKLLDKVLALAAPYAYVPIIFLLNKFDDLYDEEFEEQFISAESIIKHHVEKIKFDEKRCSYQGLSAEYAYMYRYVFFNEIYDGLTLSQKRKLGVEEYGKQAKSWDEAELQEKLGKTFSAKDYNYSVCEEQMPGYGEFRQKFNHLLRQIDQIYANKIQKLLKRVAEKEIDKNELHYVQQIHNDPILQQYCTAEIESIVTKYINRISILNIDQFIAKVVQYYRDNFLNLDEKKEKDEYNRAALRQNNLFLKYASSSFLAAIYEKSQVMINTHEAIKWFSLIPNVIHRQFYSNFKKILTHYFSTVSHQNLIKDIDNLRSLLIMFKYFNQKSVCISFQYIYDSIDSAVQRCVISNINECKEVYKVCSEIKLQEQPGFDNKVFQQHVTNTINIIYETITTCTINDIDSLAEILIKMNRQNDVILNKFVSKAITNGDKWLTYLVFQDLIDNYVIGNNEKQYNIYMMIKYVKFPNLTIENFHQCNYQFEQYRQYANIINFFPKEFNWNTNWKFTNNDK